MPSIRVARSMPSIRVARLCELRQKEVQQPIKLHHARPSHAKKRLRRHRQGMLPCPSSPSCAMFKVDGGCIAKQDLKPLFQSSCGYPLIKRRPFKVNLPQGPSTRTEFSHHRAHVDDHENPFDDLHGENVGTYHQLQSSKRRTKLEGKAKSPSTHINFSRHRMHVDGDFHGAHVGTYRRRLPSWKGGTYRRLPNWKRGFDSEDDDYRFDDEVLDSSLFAYQKFDKAATSSKFTKMHVNNRNNHTSVALSCFDKVSATNQMPNSKTESTFHPKSPNILSYTTPMHNKSILPIDTGDSELCNINVFTKQEPTRIGRTSPGSTMCRHYATMSVDSDHEVPISPGLLLSKQRAFPYDDVFYHKPKSQVNAPRRARKLEPASCSSQHSIKHRHAPPRLSKKSNARKVHFQDSLDSTTKSLLPSHDGTELPAWRSPLKSNVAMMDQSFLLGNKLEGESWDKLECVAVHESAETTRGIMKCLRLAENINSEVANSLNTLYQQGGQTQSAHEHTLDIDHNLSAVQCSSLLSSSIFCVIHLCLLGMLGRKNFRELWGLFFQDMETYENSCHKWTGKCRSK